MLLLLAAGMMFWLFFFKDRGGEGRSLEGNMTRQEFEKLVDEFGALCNQEGLTGSENATDAANETRQRLIDAWDEHVSQQRPNLSWE